MQLLRTPVSFVLGIVLLGSTAAAQVRWEGQPVGLDAELPPLRAELVSAVPNVAALRAEVESHETHGAPVPFRYGVPLPVHGTLENSGEWTVGPDGDLVWRLRVTSPGAYSIGIQFDDWYLPTGTQMFVYDDAREHVFGAYDERNANPDGHFVVEPFPGETAILEVRQPAWVQDTPRLSLQYLIHDYRDVLRWERVWNEGPLTGQGGGAGAGGDCVIPANCPPGDPFPDQKRTVVRTLHLGVLCTGSLLNNTAGDGSPLVYTANHCGQTSATVFRFNDLLPGCGTGTAPVGQNISGATLLATDAASDGRLLRINNPIPSEWAPYFAGWSRSTADPTFGMSLHHPGGQPLSIAIDDDGGEADQIDLGGLGVVEVWRMEWQQGGTPGASGGAPLFDQDDRTRGVLTGTPASCASADFGRLDVFWDNANLATFLDPIGSGATAIDGFDPSGVAARPVVTGIAPTSIEAVRVDVPASITLSGTGFLGTTGVSMDGIALSTFPAEFVVPSDTELLILDPPQVTSLGPVTIEVQHPGGNATTSIYVLPNDPPVTELEGSSPSFLFSANGLSLLLGGDVGDFFFLGVSGDLLPSALPGFVSWDIGNNFTTLFSLGAYAVGGSGYVALDFPLTGSFAGITVHVQSAVLDASGLPTVFPLTMTNTQTGTFLF